MDNLRHNIDQYFVSGKKSTPHTPYRQFAIEHNLRGEEKYAGSKVNNMDKNACAMIESKEHVCAHCNHKT